MKLYSSKWARLRALFLQANPLCRYCERLGRTTAATVVDHVKPHRGDPVLFWRQSNWQGLCDPCHNRVKQHEERGGIDSACGTDGWPIAPDHPWNAGKVH